MTSGSKTSTPEEVHLHSFPEFRDWVRKDLISYDDSAIRRFFKKMLMPLFLAIFNFKKTHRALAERKELLADGEPAGARLRLMHTLLAHDYVVALEPDFGRMTPAKRAASLVASALVFHQKIKSGNLEDDLFRGKPLNMRQYPNLFGRSIVPAPPHNKHVDTPDSEHIVVLAGRQAFRLQVLAEGKPVNGDTLLAQFESVVRAAQSPDAHDQWLGALTACNRFKSARMRERLGRNPVNAASLETIDTALLTVSLDLDLEPGSLEDITRLGYSGNYRNRWYEKSSQLVVFGNGEAAVILSFPCYLDGTIGTRYAAELFSGAQNVAFADPAPDLTPSLQPHKLELAIDADLLADAEREASSYIRDDRDIFRIEGIGKDFFKSRGISPDSSIQMALLLAGRKVFGHNLNLRQFINVRRFAGGTLELPYVTTQEAEKFLNAATEQKLSKPELAKILREAVQSHKDIVIKTFNGRSPKTIFNFALMDASAVKRKLAPYISGFFRRIGYKKYVSDMVGTSEHTADIISSSLKIEPGMRILGRPGIHLPFLRYFGMHYLVEPNSILFIFMPAKHCVRDLSKMNSAIEESLHEIKEMLLSESQ